MRTDFSELCVLAVDDNAGTLKIMELALSMIGVGKVHTAPNGKYAKDLLKLYQGRVDLIVCDWNMPKLTGLELLKDIRIEHPEMPFMMVTGNADIESVKKAHKHGVSAYITKPFSPQQFKDKITAVLSLIPEQESAWDLEI